MDTYKYDIEEINAINQDMLEHIDGFHKESEIPAAYTEHSTTHFSNVAKITVNSVSTTPQKKKSW